MVCMLISEAQRLVISPRGTQIKTVHSGSIFTCTVSDYQQPADWTTGPTIRWLGPGRVPITATRGRSHAHSLCVLDFVLFITIKNNIKSIMTFLSAFMCGAHCTR